MSPHSPTRGIGLAVFGRLDFGVLDGSDVELMAASVDGGAVVPDGACIWAGSVLLAGVAGVPACWVLGDEALVGAEVEL